MTVYDIMQLFIDPDVQHIQIWSDDEEKIVYDGDYGDIPEHMNYAEVSSIDNVYADNKGVICLNVWGEFNIELYAINENESTFVYGGYHFVPYRQFNTNEKKATLTALTKHLRSDAELGLCKYEWKKHNYSRESFYAASNSTSDLFRCVENNKVYIPGENELFEIKED